MPKFYTSVEVRMMVEAKNQLEAETIAQLTLAAIDKAPPPFDRHEIDVKGSDIIACTKED